MDHLGPSNNALPPTAKTPRLKAGVRVDARFMIVFNHERGSTVAKYLISFPSAAMVVPDDDWEAVVRDSHSVIDEAKAAGVYVFGGGIDESVPPALVSANGTVAEGGYPWAPPLNGGLTVLELPSREVAVAWAARIAKACRCDQELRVFGFDPQS